MDENHHISTSCCCWTKPFWFLIWKTSRNPLNKIREIKNKYEIPVIIRKVKMTKRMRKQTYQWYQCSGEGTHCSAAAAMKEVTQWRQWWRKSLLNGSDSVWSTNLLIGEGDFGEGGQIGVMVQPQENDSCWFSFFLRKLCPCSIKIQKKIEEEDQGVERERWRRILGRRCEKGNPCRSWVARRRDLIGLDVQS